MLIGHKNPWSILKNETWTAHLLAFHFPKCHVLLFFFKMPCVVYRNTLLGIIWQNNNNNKSILCLVTPLLDSSFPQLHLTWALIPIMPMASSFTLHIKLSQEMS
jgi:hypothetical protein